MATTSAKATLNLSSAAFEHQGFIPSKYTCEGENINPPVTIEGIPKETTSLVLIMDDPDAPGGTFDHWIMWNIPPTEVIDENSLSGTAARNSRGEYQYTGPCPPSGTHRYYFKIYALDSLLDLDGEVSKQTVVQALQNHVIGYGELIGLYKRHHE